MSDLVTVTVYRSDSWVRAERLRTGCNVPEKINVTVDPATVPVAVRELMLELGAGEYRDVNYIGYSRQWTINGRYSIYGSECIYVDAVNPTPEAIGTAIVEAVARVRVKQVEDERETAEREEKRAAEAEATAAKETAKLAARELLAEEFAARDRDIARLKAMVAELEAEDDEDE